MNKKKTPLILSIIAMTSLIACSNNTPESSSSNKESISLSENQHSQGSNNGSLQESSPSSVVTVSITIKEPTNNILNIGDVFTPEIETKIINDNNMSFELPELVLESSNENVIKIEDKKCVALKEGSAKIVAKAGNFVSNEITLIVQGKKVESIEITNKKAKIGLGLEYELEAKILPLDAPQEWTIQSSNELYIKTSNHTIRALKLTTEPITITAKAQDKIATMTIEVLPLNEVVLPEITEKLEKSSQIEKTSVNAGTYKEVKKDKNDALIAKNDASFNVYSNNKVEVIKETKNDKKRLTKGIVDSSLYSVEEKYLTENTFETVSANKKVIVQQDATYDQVLQTEAEELVNLASVNGSTSHLGVSNAILYDYVNSSNYFANSAAKEKLTYEENENTIKIKSTFSNSSANVVKIELSLVFEDGLLVSVTGSIDKNEGSYDDESFVGELIEHIDINASLTKADRVSSPETTFKFENLYFQNYTPYLTKSYSGEEESLQFNVGEKAYLKIKNMLPSSATTSIDEIEIVSVSNPDAATINYGSSLTFTAPCEELQVTVKSKISNIEKIITVKVLGASVQSIHFYSMSTSRNEYYLPSMDVINYERTFAIKVAPDGVTPNIQINLKNNTANASVTKVEGSTLNQYKIIATTPGNVDVEIIETSLGESHKLTKTVTYFDKTKEAIADYFSTANFKYSGAYSPLTINKTSSTGGTLSFVGLDDFTYTANWQVSDDFKIVFSNKNVEGSYDATFSDISLQFNSKSDLSCFRVTYEDDLYEPHTFYFYC